MGAEQNKAVVRRFVSEVFERGSADAVDELVADDFVGHTWGNADREGLKAAMGRVAQGLTDVAFVIEDEIAETDRVAVRVTARARQVGEFMGRPPSGRSYEIGEIHVFRLRDGRIVEHWHHYDQLGLMRQLGATPGGG
jgi:steroid delta-isomerase-like uncharacterized protein